MEDTKKLECKIKDCKCVFHIDKEEREKICPPHSYIGDGWYEVENGVRVRKNNLCSICRHQRVVQL